MRTVQPPSDPLDEEQRWALPVRLSETEAFRAELERLSELAPESEARNLRRIARAGDRLRPSDLLGLMLDRRQWVTAMLSLERREARKPPAIFIELPLEGCPRVHVVCRPTEQQRLFEDVLEDSRLGELIAKAFQLEEEWAA